MEKGALFRIRRFFRPMQFFLLGLMMVFSMATFTQPAFAEDGSAGTNAEVWIIDQNNDAESDIIVKFGDTLGKNLGYDIGGATFQFNDSLEVYGDFLVTQDVDFSTATSFMNVTESSDPSTCSVGMQFYNTTSNKLKVCTATNTWSLVTTGVDVNTFFVARTTASANYTTLGEFIYSGTSVEGAISAINATMHIATGATSYSARIWDTTNSQVIAEVTGLTNNTAAIQSFGTISNLPSGQSLFQVQMKRVGGSTQQVTLGTVQVIH